MAEDETLETHPLEPVVLDQHRIMVGDLVIDLAMRTIHSRSAKSVALSGNEFAALTTLAKSTGRYVAKQDLLLAVAGEDSDAHHSVVDVYIKYLRRKLQEAESAATIEKWQDESFRLLP